MTINRPFARLGIADLEEIFNKQSDDLTVLARLRYELGYRQVPRALALQEKVRKVELSRANEHSAGRCEVSVKPPDTSPEKVQQLDLLGSAPKGGKSIEEELPSTGRTSSPASTQPLPQLALDDACRILKVGLGDSWEKIEVARRKIVQKSSPALTKNISDGQIEKLLSEAQLANDAATVIAARRRGIQ